jgi:hypothetical protein
LSIIYTFRFYREGVFQKWVLKTKGQSAEQDKTPVAVDPDILTDNLVWPEGPDDDEREERSK